MPELPEVEVVKKILESKILNHTIIDIKVFWSKVLKNSSPNDFVSKLKGQTIKALERRGKHLIFYLSDYVLLSHLRMEGRYLIVNDFFEINKLNNIIIVFQLDNRGKLIYRDTRKFGTFYLYPLDDNKSFLNFPPLQNLGPDANSPFLSAEILQSKLLKKRIPIKVALLDQSIISGIGNIYASEILFLSHIHPEKPSNTLTINEFKQIIKYSRKVLNDSIKEGGSTISTFEPAQDVHGRFQLKLYVYHRQGKECKVCKTMIQKIIQSQRSTYFCPNCQKKNF